MYNMIHNKREHMSGGHVRISFSGKFANTSICSRQLALSGITMEKLLQTGHAELCVRIQSTVAPQYNEHGHSKVNKCFLVDNGM